MQLNNLNAPVLNVLKSQSGIITSHTDLSPQNGRKTRHTTSPTYWSLP